MSVSISVANIFDTTKRIPFDNFDALILQDYLKRALTNGLDITLAVRDSSQLVEMMGEGVVMLKSDLLDASFFFVKVDAGTGFFGKQKSNILFYLGDVNSSSFTAGPIFNSFARAVTSINNVYRGVGALKGASL